jgi:hypothetical protein
MGTEPEDKVIDIQQLRSMLSKADEPSKYTFRITLLDHKGNLLANPVITSHAHMTDGGLIVLPEGQSEQADKGASTLYPWARIFEVTTVWEPSAAKEEPGEFKGNPYL